MLSYNQTKISAGKQDGFSQVLAEAKSLFDAQQISILGEGYTEILIDDALWQDYKGSMLKCTDASEAETLGQLMDNSRVTTLAESISGITPISSLSVPVIRKLWPRMAMKNAIPTEAVKLPKFSVGYMLPYVLKNGKKYFLPEAILPGAEGDDLVKGQPLFKGVIELDDFAIGSDTVRGARKGFDLIANLPDGAVASKTLGDSIDPDFAITDIVVEVTPVGAGAPVLETISNLRIGTGLQGDIFYSVKHYAKGDYVNGVLKAGAVPAIDMLFGRLDRAEGTLMLTSSNGAIKGVKIRGRLSSEYNVHAESVGFDITTRDITIGTGVHINAPLPIEFLQDVMALYNIDGASKVVDIMTNVLALQLDKEMSEFITDAYVRTPTYTGRFDCKPMAGYSGTPQQWREMLKPVIDHWAAQIKQDNYFQGGKFVIVGNQIDVDLIPNVSWTFVGSSSERSGVEADYSIGAVSGSQRYEVIATPAIPQGRLYMFFVSAQDDQMTYKYFPYTFNVEKGTGYADPNFPNVPSIMLAKRHKLEVFKDAICAIDIVNNNGDMNFSS